METYREVMFREPGVGSHPMDPMVFSERGLLE